MKTVTQDQKRRYINIQVDDELFRQLKVHAILAGVTLSKFIETTLTNVLMPKPQKKRH
jgi:post-segregation antitoxin (ccd killing protein)